MISSSSSANVRQALKELRNEVLILLSFYLSKPQEQRQFLL